MSYQLISRIIHILAPLFSTLNRRKNPHSFPRLLVYHRPSSQGHTDSYPSTTRVVKQQKYDKFLFYQLFNYACQYIGAIDLHKFRKQCFTGGLMHFYAKLLIIRKTNINRYIQSSLGSRLLEEPKEQLRSQFLAKKSRRSWLPNSYFDSFQSFSELFSSLLGAGSHWLPAFFFYFVSPFFPYQLSVIVHQLV